MAKLGTPGHTYDTRVGKRVLIARDVAAVENSLIDIDHIVGVLQGGGDILVRPELAKCLERWVQEMNIIGKKRAATVGVIFRNGYIIATSAYRPLGTPCALGTPFADNGGALDSHDEWGHWSGWAIDVPTRFTRESYFPVLTIEECWAAAERAGLVRPFKSEYWHWRPAAAIIARVEKG